MVQKFALIFIVFFFSFAFTTAAIVADNQFLSSNSAASLSERLMMKVNRQREAQLEQRRLQLLSLIEFVKQQKKIKEINNNEIF